MKKVFYSLAILAAAAGCAKENASEQISGKVTVDLTLRVESEQTKVVYDGDSHINWLAGDALEVMIAPARDAESNVGAYRYSSFTIGEDLENPVFSGKMDLMDVEALDEMWVFGFYPSSADASNRDCNIKGKKVNLPGVQTFTPGSWDGKADIMALYPVQLEGTPGGYSGSYRWTSDLTVRFAHVAGFGCLSFAGLSDALGSETLNKVIITATNAEAASNPLAGTFAVNLNEDVMLGESFSYSGSAQNTLTLNAAEPMAIKDSKVWFVANPGTYDVTIQAVTADHKITYTRTGLVIERAKIAAPVLNLKDTDTVASTAVDVTGKTWAHNTTDAYNASGNAQYFISGRNTVDWGTSEGCELMEMNLSYPGVASASYGTPQNKNGIYTQDLNYSSGRNLAGGKIAIQSSSSFVGMKAIKVNAGDYKQSWDGSTVYTSKINVYVTDADGKHQLGEGYTITGSTATREGEDFIFETGNYTSGVVTVEFSDFSYGYSAPYIGELAINPAPGVKLGAVSGSLLSPAAEGSFDCAVAFATSVEVSADAEWISASYADGKVSYSVEANTGDANRTGVITVKATNENGTTEKTYTLTQLGAQYKEYVLNLTYDDIKDALLAAGAEDLAADKITSSTYYTFTITANAADAAGAVAPIEIECKNVLYKNSVEKEAISVYGGSTYGLLVSKTPVYAVTAAEAYLPDETQQAPAFKVGKTSADTSVDLKEAVRNTYSCSIDFSNEYAYFSVGASSWTYRYHDIDYIKVTFLK